MRTWLSSPNGPPLKNGVSDKATFERGDVFVADFTKATVVVLFLTPEMNIRLRPRLLNLKAGTRVVANTFAIGDWNPDQIHNVTENCERFCTARLWLVPARVNGTWQLPGGELVLKQTYQTFSGALKSGAGKFPVSGRLRGEQITFHGGKTQYTARVDGDVMEGFARTAGVDEQVSRDAPKQVVEYHKNGKGQSWSLALPFHFVLSLNRLLNL